MSLIPIFSAVLISYFFPPIRNNLFTMHIKLLVYYGFLQFFSVFGSIFFWNNWLITSISYTISNILILIIICLKPMHPMDLIISIILIMLI